MKKQVSIIAAIGIFAGVMFGIMIYNSMNPKKYHPINSGSPQLQYVTDFTDIRRVVGAAENVFVGKVIKNMGRYTPKDNESNFPRTIFQIQPIYNIKGEVNDKIVVRQMGGYDEYGRLFVPGDADLLQDGEVYILSGGKGDGFYWIDAHPNAHLNLDISGKNIRDEISKNKIVQDFKDAYKNEVYFDNDEGDVIKIGSDINAYKDLTEEQKGELENFDNGFIE